MEEFEDRIHVKTICFGSLCRG